MKVAFAGTPEFAAAALEAILAAGFEVPLVLTQPDRPAGRGMQLQPSPVKQVALAAGIPVHQPEKLRTPEQQAPLAAAGCDVLVVAAYGIILPQAVLDLPRYGCLNIHASLLPRWRGAAPIHRAIEAGDLETGITIMQMDAGLDTGPMLTKRVEPIQPDDTTGSLHDRLAWIGAELIVEALEALPAGTLVATPQPAEGVTYAAKIGKAEATVDWTRPAIEIERAVRAFNPFPGALATLDGTPIKLWRARAIDAAGTPGEVLLAEGAGVIVACGEGALCVTELQKPGARRMPAADFLRGMPIAVGSRFDPVAG
ncbi:methionyl-tRNA formyltransferase [Zoogloea sp.]|uniref:methionyl-tRNA formyltransferase n=1 Tax=Zoogloea sp. TaxID=49181 RepID=UPI0035AE3B5C